MAVDLGRALRSVRLWQWGVLIAVIGAVVVIVGAVQTTASKLPDYCDDGTLVAKFNFENGDYVFEKPAGNENVVTITNGTATGGQWSSTIAIHSIIVKGGTGAFRIDYVPPATSGTFFNDSLPPVGNGNIPDISNLQFCGSGTPTTSTTAPPATTTTTGPPGTTTTVPTTTTTSPVGSTTTTQVGGVSVTRIEPVGDSSGGGDLPRTGAPSVPLIVLGAAMVAVGLGLVILSRSRDRNLRT